MPNPVHAGLKRLYRKTHYLARKAVSSAGMNLYPSGDFYSPIPVLAELERTRRLWDRPSELVGVPYDLDRMEALWRELVGEFGDEYARLPPYEENKKLGMGPGFTVVDALTLYLMMRRLAPRRYIEVGSGFSTYYSWVATRENRRRGRECDFRVVDPFPRPKLRELEGVEVEAAPAQEVPLEFFGRLQAGDLLFIDTTHVLKLGGEVAYLYLEVVPRLAPGVVVHAHDIHFPYNVPYPVEQYVFGTKWPQVWTEAMLLQAFLAFNSDFEILLSAPLLRFHREAVLRETIPDYRPVESADYDTHFGSLWFHRLNAS